MDPKGVQGHQPLKRKINPTRAPIEHKESLRRLLDSPHATALVGEPRRCVHIGDRKSDLYELFCAAPDAGARQNKACRRRQDEGNKASA